MSKGEDYVGVNVTYFCHDGAGCFVMAKRKETCRDEHGRWDIGGGGLEFGDTAEDTVRKEVKEEYCADVIELEFLGYRDVHRTNEAGNQTHWIALDFRVRVDASQVDNGEPHKFEAVEWFTLDTLPEPVHSQLPRFLELYHVVLTGDVSTAR